MPNWKKLIVSGSDATLNSLNVIDTGTFGDDITITSGSFRVETFNEGLDFFNGSNYTQNKIRLTSAQNMQFLVGGSFQFSGGNVNILSGNELQLQNATNNGRIRFDNIGGDDEELLNIKNESGTSLLQISGSGNVGIGQAPDSKTLSVTGTIRASGEVFFSHFDAIGSNPSRFRDNVVLRFGTSRIFGIVYDSSDDQLQFVSGSNNLLTLNGDGAAEFSSTLAVTGNSTLSGQLFVKNNSGVQISDTADSSTSKTTLTSFAQGGNSRFKIKGGNFITSVFLHTNKNDFKYAEINSSYNGSESTFKLFRSNSDTTDTDATTTISTGASTFADAVTAAGNIHASGSDSEIITDQIFRAAQGTMRFRKGTNTWDAMRMSTNGKLELAAGGSNDRGELVLVADYGATPRAGVIQFQNESQGSSFLFTDTNKRLRFHTSDPGENDTVGAKVIYSGFPDDFTIQGNIMLDDNSGDSPQISFRNENEVRYNVSGTNGGNFQITRQDNGGADFTLVGDSSNFTGSYIQVGNSNQFGYNTVVANNITAGGNVKINTGNHLFFDGAGNSTYISEDIADRLRIFVGGSEFARFTEDTSDTITFFHDTTFGGTVKPSGNSQKDLGGSSNRWATVYANAINTNGVSTFGNDIVLDDHIDHSPALKFVNQNNEEWSFFNNSSGKLQLYQGSNQRIEFSSGGPDFKTGATFNGDVTVTGTLIAQEFKTELVSASIVFESGSSQFGNSADDTHDFTGSVNINSPTTGVRIDLEDDTAKTRLLHNLHAFKIQVDPDNADSNSNFRIEIDGSEYFRIDNSGDVGIGTSSPAYTLDVAGTIRVGSGGSVQPLLSRDSATGGLIVSSVNNSGDFIFKGTGGNEKFRITDGGNVGIGTTSPSTRLHLSGSSAADAGIRQSRDGVKIWTQEIDSNGKLQWAYRSSEGGSATQHFTLNDTGQAILHSYGSGNYTGTLAKSLGVDSSGNIIEFTGGSGGGTVSSITSGADNRIAIFNGTDSLEGDANLTFTGGHILVGQGTEYRSKDTGGSVRTLMRVNGNNELEYGWSANGPVKFMGGGSYTERMRIHTTGNIGIGTSTPDHLLHVEFANTDTAFSGGSGGAWGSEGIRIENTSATNNTMAMLHFRNSDADIHVAGIRQGTDDSDLGFFFEGTEKIRFTNDGKVGIGTTSPASNLHIKTSVDNSVAQGLIIERSANTDRGYINYNGGGFQFRSTVGDPIVFGETDAEHMRILPDGNVGIGTSSPAYRLEVQGDSTSGVLAVQNAANDRNTFRSSNAAGTRTADIGNTSSGHGIFLVRNSSGTANVQLLGSGNSYFTGGSVGIGTTGPTRPLHVVTTADQIAKFESSDAAAKIEVADNTTSAYINANSSNASFGPFSSYSDTGNIRIFSGSVDHTGNGVGAFGATPSTNTKWKVFATVDTSADTGFNNTVIDLNVQGSTAVTGDRTYRGLYIDIDSSATGGDTNDEVRLSGNYVSINDTGDSDLITGVDVIAQTQMSDASSQTSNIRGVYASSKAANTGGLVNNLIGVQGNANMGSTAGGDIGSVYGIYGNVSGGNTNKTPSNVYGGFFKIDPGANFSSTLGTSRGLFSEIEIDGNTTTSNLRAIEGIIDLNTGSHDNLYQLKLDTQIHANASQTGGNYGIVSTGAARHFLQGKTLIGSTHAGAPGAELHIYSTGSGLVGISIQNSTTSFDTNISSDGLSIGVNGNDAYFFSREAGNMYLAVNDDAINGVTINSAGNVGVGNISPGYQLDVGGDINTSTGVIRRGGNAIIKSTGAETMIGPGGSGVITFHNSSTMASSDEKVRIDANGNLLLNNTSAGARLDIREDSNYAIRIEDASGHYFRVNTGGDTEIRGNVTVGGTITAQEFHTELVSASIVFESGSTIFGNSSDDTHEFTGTVKISGDGSNQATFTESGNGDFTIAAVDDIRLSAGGNDIVLRGASSAEFGRLANSGQDFVIKNINTDKDIIFQADDGSGGTETYFFVDGSGNRVQYNKNLRITDSRILSIGSSDDLQIFHNSADTWFDNYTGNINIRNRQDDGDIIFYSDDGSGGNVQYLRIDGGITSIVANKDLLMGLDGDGGKIKLGASQDLQLYHDGSNSYITQNNTGDLYIQQNVDDRDIIFQSDNGSGGVTEYFKLDGSNVNVSISKQFNWLDSVVASFGTHADLQIFHNGSDSKIQSSGVGDIIIEQRNDDKDIVFNCDDGSGGLAEYLRIDGSSHTVNVSKNLYLFDGVGIKLGNSFDLDIKHDGSDSYITNGTGNLYIRNSADDKDIQFQSDNGSGGLQMYFELDGSTKSLDVGDGVNVNYDNISTSNSGTVVRGGFLNPASEANMVHLPHVINDLAGFNRWSNGTITTSGFYKSRGGSAGSYSYSNEVTNTDGGWANAFDAHSSTAGSWYSDNGTDGVFQSGSDTPGVVTLEWPNEATYSLWAGIVFGSNSFTATYVKIEAYRGGAWQTLCEITDNTDQVVLRQVGSNSGGGSATTKLRYTLGGSVNNSYFRIHSLYMANYRAGDNNLNNTGTDTTRGINFLERYKNNYAHGHFYPGANNTYDIGSSSYKWNNVNAVTLNGNLVGTIHSNTTANTQTQGNNSTKVATTAYVDTAISNINASNIDGSGTATYIAKFSDSNTLTSSGMFQAASNNFSIGGVTTPNARLSVEGSISVGTTATDVLKLHNSSGVGTIDGYSTRNIAFGSVTNGEVMRIDNTNGRVGIGTTVPQFILDVDGLSMLRTEADMWQSEQKFMRIGRFGRGTGTSDRQHYLTAKVSTGAADNFISFNIDDGSTSNGTSYATNVLKLRGDSSAIFGGKVGIGTTSPGSPLHIAGTAGSVAGSAILFNGSTAIWQPTNSTLTIRPAGTDAAQFSSTSTAFFGRTDLQKDLRIRGNDSSGNLGVVRFFTDANDQLIIDTGNDGSNRTIIDGSGNATFAGDVTVGPKSNATVQVSESGGATTKLMGASVGRVGTYSNHNFEIVQNSSAAITIDTSKNSTFAGNLRTPASGKLFLWTGHDSNFLQYNLWQASASGGMTIKNIASGGDIIFQTNSTTAITINSSQNTTLHGNVTTLGGLTVGDSNADTAQIGLHHLLGYCENTDVDTGTEDIKSLPLATYQAVFFDYVVKNGTNLRAGTVTAVHDGTNVEFTDTSTKDLGDTSGVTLSVDISGSNMRLRATTTSDNWTVKANIRGIKV